MVTRSLAEAFNPRSNSIGFLRWFLAFLVIFSHAGPLGGFYGGHDLGTQWSSEQSFGGVAVTGFFFLSGFLITKSRVATPSTGRYLWKRVLRIYPAWLATLLVTAFALGPLGYWKENGTLDGYFTAATNGPFSYIWANMFLPIRQTNIADMGQSLPLFQQHGIADWNGAAWTLAFEFTCYLAVGFLGLAGILARRQIAAVVAFAVVGLSMIQWLRIDGLWAALPWITDFRALLLFAPFAWGVLFALFADKIPINDVLGVTALAVAVFTYGKGGWLVIGQYFFAYFLLWFSIRVQFLKNWERFGDFSYGIYIIGWPVMQLGAFFGLQGAGWLIYHVVIVLAAHVYAFISWHLVEKPAMSLKNWTPRSVSWLGERLGPPWRSFVDRVGWKPVLREPREVPGG